ncbi:uncharacterized protein LOC114916524 [Cajanus cajan]|nr:uncharacterized protein LOC114916524 [Cajanus cajan]
MCPANTFTPPSPPLATPFLISQPHTPSLFIVALSTPSLALFRRLHHSTPAASLLFPELPLSRPNHTVDLFALSPSALLAAVPFPVPAHRTHALTRALLSARMAPRSILVLDSLQPPNFRGSLSSDEMLAFKLKSSAKRKRAEVEKMLPGVPYYPFGSVVDGFGAVIFPPCQALNVR